jgi:hypothetical protein
LEATKVVFQTQGPHFPHPATYAGLRVTFQVSFVLFIVATARLRRRANPRPGDETTSPVGHRRGRMPDRRAGAGADPYPGPNELQLVPFARRRELLLNTVGNVLLFLPFGAALCLRGCTTGRTVLSGVALSVGLEITQLVVPGRTTSVDDVLLNTLGALLGHALLSRWAPSRTTQAKRSVALENPARSVKDRERLQSPTDSESRG